MATFTAIFYVGVTSAQRRPGAAQSMVMTATAATATNSTIARMSTLAAAAPIEIQVGGQMVPTSLQDPTVSVQIFDSTLVGPESETAALIRKAQEIFDDPGAAVAAGHIDGAYRDALARFKAGITHCAISTMRITKA